MGRRKSKELRRLLCIFLSVFMIMTAVPLDVRNSLGIGIGDVQAAAAAVTEQLENEDVSSEGGDESLDETNDDSSAEEVSDDAAEGSAATDDADPVSGKASESDASETVISDEEVGKTQEREEAEKEDNPNLSALDKEAAKAPVGNVLSGTYSEGFKLELVSETNDARIYYTVDGSEPDAESSVVYADYIEVNESVTIKAIATADGYSDSEISVFEYEIVKEAEIKLQADGDNSVTYVFDATTLTATKDQEAIAEGTTFADAFYVSKGSNTKRTNKENPGPVTSIEIGKNLTGYMEFTVTGSADVAAVVSSTGSSNESAVALVKVVGDDIETVENEEKIETVKTTTKATLTYYNLQGGTYRFVSPESDFNRGYRVYNITSVMTLPELVETEYLFDATTLTATKDQETIAEGTTFADAYYVSKGSNTKRTNKENPGPVTSIEIGKNLTGSMEFTVSRSADVTAVVSSTGSSNESAVALVRVVGDDIETVENEEKIETIKTTTKETLTYYNLEEGTYRFVSPESTFNRGYRLYSIKTVQITGGIRVRKAWDEVEDPVINSVALSEDGGSIEVAFTMVTGFNGADSVTGVMYNAETGDEVMNATKVESKKAIFKPTKSGKYYFILSADRSGEETKVSGRSEAITFVLPLEAPNITSVTNKGKDSSGKGRLEIAWSKVNEAVKYNVEAVQITKAASESTAEGTDSASDENVKVLASTTVITSRETILEGLPIGEEVTIRVYAVKGETISEPATVKAEVTGNNDRTWGFASYGSNASTGDSATANDDGSIDISTPSSTKIVPGSTDGLGFYYTRIDPSENFTLTAKIKVKSWPYDNGQEGFGLMVSDAVGEHGDGAAFWNNSYQAAVTQIQYNWDPTIKDGSGNYVGGITNVSSDSATIFQEKMRLGLGWIARDGVTLDQKTKAESGQIDTPSGFTTDSGTFETSVADAVQSQLPGITSGSSASAVQNAFKDYKIQTIGSSAAASYGQLNIVAADKAAKTVGETVRKIGNISFTDINEVRYQIQRNNTGYVLRYLSNESLGNENSLDIKYTTDDSGNRISYAGTYNGVMVVPVDGQVYEVLSQKVIYDENRNALTQIDKKYIYLGMFSARKTSVFVENFTLDTIDAEDDYPQEAREYEAVALNANVMSAETSNSSSYNLIFNANADGTLSVTQDGKVIAREMAVTAGTWASVGSTLKSGNNSFELVFTPTPGYAPSEYQYLVIDKDNPEATSVKLLYTVKYTALEGGVVYVAPGAEGSGSKADPASIYDAVSFAAPGQKIYLAAGTYKLGGGEGGSDKNIRINRGTDGTKSKMITMETDPNDVEDGKRAVLDFSGATGTGSAFVLSGNYWHLKNFDVTGSKNGEKGLQVSGKNNIIEMVNTYKNGNTGIEIARDGSVGRDLWPSDNLVLNCTSYLNYDAGFEDADGFAAKITAGDGNRFVGCVSAYNADDGWDLFAKVQSGSIGSVTLDGCIAYKNGYLLGRRDGADYEVFIGEGAVEFEAGNGNGFKLGGDGMSGYHVLKNSYAFANKANGIDSNSCPDIQVFNSVSYNNGTNLTLSTYDKAINSDYTVDGLISIGGASTSNDSIKTLGNQIQSKIYNANNFFWNGSASVNAADSSLKATVKIFVSTDMSDLGVSAADGRFVNRDGDGNIVFGGFLQLKSADAADDAETKAVLEYIANNGIAPSEAFAAEGTTELVVFAKDVTKLGEVESKTINGVSLPDGFNWMDSEIVTSAYEGTTTEFAIVNSTTNETSTAKVSFVVVNGLELEAESNIGKGLFGSTTLSLSATPSFAPDVDIDPTYARFVYSFNDSKKLALRERVTGNTIKLSRQSSSGEGNANYVATMQYTAGGKSYKLTSNAVTFLTRTSGFEFSYTLSGDAVEKEDGSLYVDTVGKNFKLNDLKVSGVGTNEKVNISIADTKILKLSGNEFKAVDSGNTSITLTAAADKTVTEVISVKVKGKEFAVGASTLTIDKAREDGATFSVSELGTTSLGDVTVSRVLKNNIEMKAYPSYLEVSKVIGNVYRIGTKANSNASLVPQIPTGTYTLVLKSGAEEFEDVTLIVNETKPSVSIRQTKAVNLFYKAGTTGNTGALTATSKLAGVSLKISSESDFNLVSDGSEYKLIMTSAAQKKIYNNDKKDKLNKNITFIASFDGYKEAYDKKVTISVNTVTKAPQYVLEIDNRTFYTQLGIKESAFRILDKDSGEYVNDATVALASSKTSYVNANKNFALDEEAGVYTISTSKSGTAKISVIDPDFSKDPATKFAKDREVILNAPISISKSNPSVKIERARLNADASFAALGEYKSKVTVRNAISYTLRNFKLEGINAASKALLPFIDYSFDKDEYNQPILVVAFKDSADTTLKKAIENGTIKKGSFTFKASFDINALTGRNCEFKLDITKDAKVTAAAGGAINLVNRVSTYATVTPSIKNIEGTAIGMYFKGAENLFSVEWDNTKKRANVYAKEDGSYRANSTYKLTPVFVVATAGGEIEITSEKQVNINVKQSSLKLDRIPVVEVSLSDLSQEGIAVINASSPKGAVVAGAVQLSMAENFDTRFDANSGNLYIGINNASSLKANKVYTIKMGITPEGSGSGARQQTVNIKVRVIK